MKYLPARTPGLEMRANCSHARSIEQVPRSLPFRVPKILAKLRRVKPLGKRWRRGRWAPPLITYRVGRFLLLILLLIVLAFRFGKQPQDQEHEQDQKQAVLRTRCLFRELPPRLGPNLDESAILGTFLGI